jgi:hypothetical protein
VASKETGVMNCVRNLAIINLTRRLSLSWFLILFLVYGVHGQGWTRFRGPNGQGISNAKTIPAKWTDEDFNWKVKLPGGGHGSPVIWEDKVFVTCEDPDAAGGCFWPSMFPMGRPYGASVTN